MRILLSAPYMIPVFERFKTIFDDARLEVVVAQVETVDLKGLRLKLDALAEWFKKDGKLVERDANLKTESVKTRAKVAELRWGESS